MLSAYQGHFLEEARFYTGKQEITIPTNKRIIINILDDEAIPDKIENAILEAQNGGAFQYFGKGRFNDKPQSVNI